MYILIYLVIKLFIQLKIQKIEKLISIINYFKNYQRN